MRLFNRLRKAAPPVNAKSFTQKNPAEWFLRDFIQPSGTGSVGKEYTNSIWVYRCANIWSGVASVPVMAIDGNGDVAERGAVADLIESPSMNLSWQGLLEMSVLHLATSGKFAWLLEDGEPLNRFPMYVQPLDANKFTIRRSDRTKAGELVSYSYSLGSGQYRVIPKEGVMVCKLPNPYAMDEWQSPLDALRLTVDGEYHARQHNKWIMERHGRIPGYVKYDDPNITTDELRTRAKMFKEQFEGSENSGKWAHLAKAEMKSFSMTSQDLDWLNGQKLGREEITAAYNIPPVSAGILDRATYSNFEQAEKALVESCFLPILRRVEGCINFIAKQNGEDQRLKFDYQNYYQALQTSEKDKIERYSKLVRSKVTPEQAAQIVGLDLGEVMPAHQQIWVPSSEVAVSMSADEPEDVAGKVQDQALNGAQITSLLGVIESISSGALTPEGGIGVLVVAFPTVDDAEARRIVAGAIVKTDPEAAKSILAGGKTAGDTPKAPASTVKASEVSKALNERWKVARWKAEMRKRKGHERDLTKKTRTYFFKQRQVVLENLADLEIKKAFVGYAGKKADPTKMTADQITESVMGMGDWTGLFEKAALPEILKAINSAGVQAILEMGSDEDFTASLMDAFVEQEKVLLATVPATTEARIHSMSEALVKTLAEGGSPEDAVESFRAGVKNVFNLSQGRSMTIARTEIGRAFEATRYEQMTALGAEKFMWVSSRDSNVRSKHQSLDSKVKATGEEFATGLKYPLDPSADPDQTINCRCTLVPVLD